MIALDVPDEPRHVEAYGLAADPGSWRRELGRGMAVGTEVGLPLIVVCGDADPGATLALAREKPTHTMLVTTAELAGVLREAGRVTGRAILHTLPDPETLPDYEGATPLPAETPLDHLPPALQAELALARTEGPVWTVFVDGQPVSFAYASARSPRWFDVSVDTLAGARQLGLATITAAAMIRDERAQGREPVWGADEGNLASLRLAQRLGFVPIDELWVVLPA